MSLTTPAGVAVLETLGADWTANEIRSVRMFNPCVSLDSVVLATVGAYGGISGIPVVHRTEVAGIGVVDLYVVNVDQSSNIIVSTDVPLQYLIV